ncbi:DUF4339 domain-containing protein [Aestuariivirga sp. YIM B02566]|uniref:DUF4339 domain-containing protein n=1 Tax=Taklimakanibacter albus TaxID=2800327 RepID=A0ACC5R155_9HYPH|nr:DUF4339 domain-containing protein [Aestuariivirga sp. YIM B02566]
MADAWYIRANGGERGPMSAEAVRVALALNEIMPADWAWREGLDDWVLIAFEPAFAKGRHH